MRWALNVVGVTDATIKIELEKERDHFLATSPIPTDKLVELNDAVRKSYAGDPAMTKMLIEARDKERAENPHPQTPKLVQQMDQAIAAAVAALAANDHEELVNVSISGALGDQLGVGVDAETRETYGDRINIALDFIKA